MDAYCTKRFNIAVNEFDAEKSVHYSWVLVVTELAVSGAQCICGCLLDEI